MRAHDRELLVKNSDPNGMGLNGRGAVDAVEENFEKTKISLLDGGSGRPARKYRRRAR